MCKKRYAINVLCFKNFLWSTLCNIFISAPIKKTRSIEKIDFLNFESELILLSFLGTLQTIFKKTF